MIQSLAESFEGLGGLDEGHPQYLDAWWVLGGVEDLGQGAQQALEQAFQALYIGQPLPFGAVTESLIVGSALSLAQCLQKQLGPLDHPLPLYTVGPLVVFEPGGECTGGQWLPALGVE